MLARDWMRRDPLTVTGDMLVSEAKKLLAESRLPALPVVDGGRLRGILTPAHCQRATEFVARTQDVDELAWFVTRLMVKDLMVRNPATVEATDTLESVLAKGRQLRISQFPVMDGGRVVGLISAQELFELCTWLLGASATQGGLTLAPLRLRPGVLGTLIDVAEEAGAVIQAVYPREPDARAGEHGEHPQRVTLRFHAPDVHAVAVALERAGFEVLEAAEPAACAVEYRAA